MVDPGGRLRGFNRSSEFFFLLAAFLLFALFSYGPNIAFSRGGKGGVPPMRTPKARNVRKQMKIRVPNKRFPGIWDQNPRSYT